ncbi:response regulator [Microcoleus sp. FACHB-831]|jgi:twitching motility two-component system response regulator PilG|uniref:response regulator transcription factor n=1 Tax=Microcoleus sp. FACHB-831 TaxID=2692827 RepID=UPI001688CB81|nr:response regulator [Microcoleus sp. FACHB-831]MBD1919607.1 response regulator [Microcoleus sp. FACHB-831]
MSFVSPNQPIILAVDDSPIMQEMVKRALGNEYKIIVADNAVDALSVIYHQTISIVLLDVSMPGVDGLELCRTIRSLPQFSGLPIIMLTARDGVFDKVQGRLAGATEYLTKPFDNEQLRGVVRNFIESNNSTTESVKYES